MPITTRDRELARKLKRRAPKRWRGVSERVLAIAICFKRGESVGHITYSTRSHVWLVESALRKVLRRLWPTR